MSELTIEQRIELLGLANQLFSSANHGTGDPYGSDYVISAYRDYCKAALDPNFDPDKKEGNNGSAS